MDDRPRDHESVAASISTDFPLPEMSHQIFQPLKHVTSSILLVMMQNVSPSASGPLLTAAVCSGPRWHVATCRASSERAVAGAFRKDPFCANSLRLSTLYERQRPPLSYLRLRQYCRTIMYNKNKATVTAEPITRLGRTFPKISVHWLPK